MLNDIHDGTVGAAIKGWYLESIDSKWYYLNQVWMLWQDGNLLTEIGITSVKI